MIYDEYVPVSNSPNEKPGDRHRIIPVEDRLAACEKEVIRLRGLFEYVLQKAEKHLDEDIIAIAESALKDSKF